MLDVEPNSPAELAGLQAGTDYILGTAEKVFKDVDILYEELSGRLAYIIQINSNIFLVINNDFYIIIIYLNNI